MSQRAARIHPVVALLPLLALAAAAQPRLHEARNAEEILAVLPLEMTARLEEKRVMLLQEFLEHEAYDGMIHALVLFERPRNEVIRFLIQSPRQVEFRPELRKAELVEEFEGGQVMDYEIRMMFMRVQYRARHGWDFEKGHVWWSLDPEFDNDLSTLEGRWEVFELGPERALARFGTRIDVGPALPGFLQQYATRTKLPESMHNVRRWIDSGGVYRP
jgi:hypothetical protein